jgi:hypothetical protein
MRAGAHIAASQTTGYGELQPSPVTPRLVAQRLNKDLDAENLAVIDCGAKTAIPFIARTCSALGIPLLALHDEDIYPEEGNEEGRRKIREQNADAEKENADIRAAVAADRLFVMQPSLEGALGIGRWAEQKPRRVLEAVRGLPTEKLPAPLVAAVEALADPTPPDARFTGDQSTRDDEAPSA